jgi:MFS family permease
MFLFAPLAALLVERVGWRWALGAIGAGPALLLLPVTALAPTLPPETERVAGPGAGRAGEPGLAALVASPRFWCFAAAFFLTPVSNLMVTTHQVAAVVEAGVEPRRAAAALGVVGLLSAFGRAGFGALSDRWGRVPAPSASYVATVAGTLSLLLLTAGGPPWLLYAFVVPFGLTLGARGPIIAALAADLYRGRSYGKMFGVITLGNRLGSAVGPWLGGFLYDLTGGYREAFLVAVLAIVAAAFALAAAGRAGPFGGLARGGG